MGAISAVLLVAFVIICVLSVLLVLVQEPDNSGMGGMLGGGNSAAFGSHSASVLTKTTVVFVILFLLLTFLLALLNKGTKLRTDLSDVATESGLPQQHQKTKPPTGGRFRNQQQTQRPLKMQEPAKRQIQMRPHLSPRTKQV